MTAGGSDRISVTLLSKDDLTGDPFPELTLRLVVEGVFADSPTGSTEPREEQAKVEIRFCTQRLTDLLSQIRAAQAALVVRERRQAEATAEECARAAQLAAGGPEIDRTTPEYRELLEQLILGLGGTMPLSAPPARA